MVTGNPAYAFVAKAGQRYKTQCNHSFLELRPSSCSDLLHRHDCLCYRKAQAPVRTNAGAFIFSRDLRRSNLGAVEWIRTTTVLLPPAPQAGASASSATTAHRDVPHLFRGEVFVRGTNYRCVSFQRQYLRRFLVLRHWLRTVERLGHVGILARLFVCIRSRGPGKGRAENCVVTVSGLLFGKAPERCAQSALKFGRAYI